MCRSRSPQPKTINMKYPWQDEEVLRTLHCRDCDVLMYDRDSMASHLRGRKHLMQQTRLRDKEVRLTRGGRRGLNDVLRANQEWLEYDDGYWEKERSGRDLKLEQERFMDSYRLDMVKAKFDAKKYDYGQYRLRKEEVHCEICDVWTKTRDSMEAHKAGVNHKKRSASVQIFECKLCWVVVTCQATLDNHMRGKDHLKREKQLQEQRKKRGENDSGGGYKTGPREMAKLSNNEVEELVQLRQMVTILQDKVKQYQVEREKCAREHGTKEVKKLRQMVEKCREEHQRSAEFGRKGILKEETGCDDDQPSTSKHRAKHEREELSDAGIKREKYL